MNKRNQYNKIEIKISANNNQKYDKSLYITTT
jgi:hypothetical protein